MPDSSPALFGEFSAPAPDAWRRQAEAELKGKPYERLLWSPEAGIQLPPLFGPGEAGAPGLSAAPGNFPYRRGNALNISGGWQIVQEIAVDNPALARHRIETAQAAGISAFLLKTISPDTPLKHFGELARGLDFTQCALHVLAPSGSAAQLSEILVAAAGEKAALLTGVLYGASPSELPAAIAAARNAPNFRVAGINLQGLAASGTTLSQQCAYALSMAVDAFDAVNEAYWPHAAFLLPVESDFLPQVARLRAFRMLFARMAQAAGAEGDVLQSPFILACSSDWNLNRYDAPTNLLRGTTEAASAIIGGAHAVALSAFDAAKETESDFSARLARNIQLLLLHESYLGQVQDPAGGAWYIEALTDAIAEAGWKLFKEIESRGGFAASAAEIAALLEAQARQRELDIRTRRRVLVGVNQYPDTSESLPELPDAEGRAGAAYESLRLRADKWAAAAGRRPLACLYMTGDLVMRQARAQFSRNLLGCGGMEISELFPNELQISQLRDIQPDVVVACAADSDYSGELLAALRAAAPGAFLVVAGKPQDGLTADGWIFAGMDGAAFIAQLLDKVLR